MDTFARLAQLYEVNASDGSLTAIGTARSIGSSGWDAAGLTYRDLTVGGAHGAGLRLDREDDDTLGITALEEDMYIHQVIGIP